MYVVAKGHFHGVKTKLNICKNLFTLLYLVAVKAISFIPHSIILHFTMHFVHVHENINRTLKFLVKYITISVCS